MKQITFSRFLQHFPNDDVCLGVIFNMRYANLKECSKCHKPTRFHRVKKRKCFECSYCGYQIYPLAGTILEGSTTSLTNWFYAMYLFSVSKNGVSAKELERTLGVTYKTAWRIGHKIREAMGNEKKFKLEGKVEVDEALIGGRVKGKKSGKGWKTKNKICLLGMVERGGRIKVIPVKNREKRYIDPEINRHVRKGTLIYTDEYSGYNDLPTRGYEHESINHSRYRWAREDRHTNNIEGFWGNLKKSLSSTYTYVSKKHLPKYLNEFTFRHNKRREPDMFGEILKRIA